MDYKKLIIATIIGLVITDFIMYSIALSRERSKTEGLFVTD